MFNIGFEVRIYINIETCTKLLNSYTFGICFDMFLYLNIDNKNIFLSNSNEKFKLRWDITKNKKTLLQHSNNIHTSSIHTLIVMAQNIRFVLLGYIPLMKCS
jgi:hypothetical protein